MIEAAAIGHAIMGFAVEDMIAHPARMLTGNAFGDSSVHNVIEADFFDWVMATPGGPGFVQRVIRRIATFNWADVEHDVLKVLYESVIRAETRKSLGEYYTPDWLAQAVVEKCVTDPLEQRVLDAACGSGTFLFAAIRRYLDAADAAGWDNAAAIAGVQRHVFGLDIHPVSVILARITYLLAIGDRLAGDRGDIEVPVHLGDSLQWSQEMGQFPESITIRIDSEDLAPASDGTHAVQATLINIAEELVFPLTGIDDPATFDRLVRDMARLAQEHTERTAGYPNVDTNVLNRYGVADPATREQLRSTFRLLCDLNARRQDSIWGYYVRNQVRPLWLTRSDTRMDVLVGNPPWVAYRFMTKAMQSTFKTFSQAYNLWHGNAVATHQDLVGLFIARAADLYLTKNGRFGFVTPLAVLSRRQYEGLRHGRWGHTLRGHITEMWDLEQVTPRGFFPVPSAVVFGSAGHTSTTLGDAALPSGTVANKLVVAGRRDRSGWTATFPQLTFTSAPNHPQKNTPRAAAADTGYGSLVRQGATITPRYLYFVTEERQASNRLGMAAGTSRVTSQRSSLEKPPWKGRPSLSEVVETRHIRDVHLGATITPFRPLTPNRAVLPVTQERLMTESEIDAVPGLNRWWDTACTEWDTHKSGSRGMTLRDRLDFQRGITAQLGGTRHRVVYTASGNAIAAARLEGSSAIIEHKLYWMAARSLDEARYLTAVLNAGVTTSAVSVYQSRGLFGTRDFDKYVWRLPIPLYDAAIAEHAQLAQLAAEAEEVGAAVELPSGVGFQRARALIRAALADAGVAQRLDAMTAQLLAQGDRTLDATCPPVNG